MSEQGLRAAVDLMHADGAGDEVVAMFCQGYRRLESGESGMIAEDDIEPVSDLPRLSDLKIADDIAHEAFAATAVVKLNGGLATSMGLDRAKSLVQAKDGRSFLDIIVSQILLERQRHRVALPLIFMNSFRTRDDTLAALSRYDALPTPGLPLDFLQSREPKLRVEDLTPISWGADPSLEWCPPGHADVYFALRSSGVLDALLAQGFRYAFCSNSDNLGAVASSRIAGWMSANKIGFVLESTRRTPADRKGGHLALRRRDGRLVLRETAQTAPEDQAALQDLDRHKFSNTNNLWIDLHALVDKLDETGGALDLPLIRNVKNVDPQDSSSPEVIQIESAMGAAVQVFDGARSILVERERFIPVKTSNDLLVLRSDQYVVEDGARVIASPRRTSATDTFVDLDNRFYKQLHDFEARFPAGPPSLQACASFVIRGDITFGSDVVAHGDVLLDADDTGDHVQGITLSG